MDHDQFFKRLMHLFLREFIELFFADWVGRFDFTRVEWLEQELFPDEKQEDHNGTAGIQEVLPVLPEAPRAQGD